MKQKIIDTATGSFRVSNTGFVSKNMLRDNVTALLKTGYTDSATSGNGWTSVAVRNLQVDPYYFIITFRFENMLLKMISFVVDTVPYPEQPGGWENWSYEKEMADKERFEQWVTEQAGTNREFSWGNIGAWFDERGGSASINLRYS